MIDAKVSWISFAVSTAIDATVSFVRLDTAASPIEAKVSFLRFDTAASPIEAKVSFLRFDTAAAVAIDAKVSWISFNSNAVQDSSSASNNYGNHPFREDVEKYWELIALRNRQAEQSASIALQQSSSISLSAQTPLPTTTKLPGTSLVLQEIAITNQIDSYLDEQQYIDSLKRNKQNDEALILILMSM